MSAPARIRANAPGFTLLEQLAAARTRIKRLQLELWRVRRSRDRWRVEAMEWRHSFEHGAVKARPVERVEQFARDRRYRENRQRQSV